MGAEVVRTVAHNEVAHLARSFDHGGDDPQWVAHLVCGAGCTGCGCAMYGVMLITTSNSKSITPGGAQHETVGL